jgi:Tol biopolymer transport system component
MRSVIGVLIVALFVSSPVLAQSVTEAFRNLTPVTSDTKYLNYDIDVSPDGKRILYTTTRTDVYGDIHVQDISGRTSIQRTFYAGADRWGRFSPDGKYIAFASDRNGNFDIFVMETDGGSAVRQVSTNATHDVFPSWSPDGKKLVYTSVSIGGETIWVADLENGSFTILGDGTAPTFSPDGKKILYQKRGTRDIFPSLWVIDVNGSNDTQIIRGNEWGATWPDWAPDGKNIIFASDVSARGKQLSVAAGKGKARFSAAAYRKTDLWTVSVNGSNLTQITTSKGADWNPRWSSDGRVYFVSDRPLGTGVRSTTATNVWSFEPNMLDELGK